MYGDDVANWVIILRGILTLYPPFNYAKAWGDIRTKSGSHFDMTQSKWVKGPGNYLNPL